MASAVFLKPGRDKSLLRRHPWVFSNAVARAEGDPRAGDTVDLVNADGRRLGRGAWSPLSQIAVRAWTFDPDEKVDEGFFRERLDRAFELRRAEGLWDPTGACRLVNAESDGLPGVVVDRYAGFVVCQFLSTGAEAWKETIARAIAETIECEGIYERSDAEVRKKEGLEKTVGVLRGVEPPDLVEIREGAYRFLADVREGHKTGFYLDQRDNRLALGDYAAGAETLNCFSYTGAFGVVALASGAARVTNVDSSGPALAVARRHTEINGLDPERIENVEADVFDLLRTYRDSRREFDLIVLDPPKFAESRAQIDRAARGYKDINLLAFKLLRPGGTLFTFSCSGQVSPDLFQKIVAGAALDAGRDARIVRRLAQSGDHPVATSFPEGLYLKGLVCKV
ncbi:class I SAM-dependent methyltransferase [Candidatus Sumerlaeota bacterium]|nr:class I SAM-dependent methyltransferase [Candidatus Sumerlaeota bacterium]